MRIDQLRQRLMQLSAKSCHEKRLLRAWLNAQPLNSGTRRQRADDFLPLSLREALPALTDELNRLASIRSEHAGGDGSLRMDRASRAYCYRVRACACRRK